MAVVEAVVASAVEVAAAAADVAAAVGRPTWRSAFWMI